MGLQCAVGLDAHLDSIGAHTTSAEYGSNPLQIQTHNPVLRGSGDSRGREFHPNPPRSNTIKRTKHITTQRLIYVFLTCLLLRARHTTGLDAPTSRAAERILIKIIHCTKVATAERENS